MKGFSQHKHSSPRCKPVTLCIQLSLCRPRAACEWSRLVSFRCLRPSRSSCDPRVWNASPCHHPQILPACANHNSVVEEKHSSGFFKFCLVSVMLWFMTSGDPCSEVASFNFPTSWNEHQTIYIIKLFSGSFWRYTYCSLNLLTITPHIHSVFLWKKRRQRLSSPTVAH